MSLMLQAMEKITLYEFEFLQLRILDIASLFHWFLWCFHIIHSQCSARLVLCFLFLRILNVVILFWKLKTHTSLQSKSVWMGIQKFIVKVLLILKINLMILFFQSMSCSNISHLYSKNKRKASKNIKMLLNLLLTWS